MKIWRIGSNWGKQIDLIPIFKKYNISFAGLEVQELMNGVSSGDLICITKGQSIEAVAKVKSITDLERVEISLADDFDFVKALQIEDLFFLNDFSLKSETYGGQGKQFHEVHGKYFNLIYKLFSDLKALFMNSKIESLLTYKKQIILQGPPGTGKTWMAKKIAKELIVPQDLGSPKELINSFFKEFNGSSPDVQAKRLEKERLLTQFQSKFPKEELRNISLESYCIGTGGRDNFCWWIERGLSNIGGYSPGSSRTYLIYFSQKDDEYKTYFRSLKAFEGVNTPQEGIKVVGGFLSDLVSKENLDGIDEFPFGWGYMIKILSSYYPNKFFPANGEKYMTNMLNLFGVNSSGKSPIEKNLLIQGFFQKKKVEFAVDVTSYEFMIWMDTHFDLKGEVEYNNRNLISKGESKLIQFHPAYTYEDFVRGIVVETTDENKTEYKVVNKVLAEFALKALNNKSSNYVLIIDEINRANLPSVLGELIYALEYRFDPENPKETSVESMYSLRDEGELDASEGRILSLPRNLYLIGTMNTADRSVGHIDYAIRRRFAFVDVLPSINPISNALAKEMFEKVSKFFVSNYQEVIYTQASPKRADTLMPDFRPEDVWIGHSYFLTDKKVEQEANDEIKIKMRYEVLPLLKEYVKDGILRSDDTKSNDPVQKLIQELSKL
ncbi:AAA family ATPase [Cyclobacterium sp. SYSU L10401]|uniref:AAA family ATPase n=1 Tax=Cyclobacterium sp. SYSU L10401 TaxID=2678657 RepID=UPI0013D7A079|nr:AAA family ATPase [Cyclobacterium sp. SYSU L10401]